MLFYDRNDVIQEYNSAWSTVNKEYTHGPWVDEPLSMTVRGSSTGASRTAGDTYYLMKDRLGSIINILDENQTLKTTYSYDAFGDPTATYHSGQVDCMYRFTGRVYDGAMGNYFYRARYYNQSLGRFFSRDPIFSLSSLYAYCHNSPTNFTDPSGMLDESTDGDVTDTAMGMYPWWYDGPRGLPCAKKGDTITIDGKTYTSTGETSSGGEVYVANDGSYLLVKTVTVYASRYGVGGGELVDMSGSGSSGCISDGWCSIYSGIVGFEFALFGYIYQDLALYSGFCFVSAAFCGGVAIGFTIRNDQSMLDMIPGGFNSEDIAKAQAIAKFNELRRMKDLGSMSVNVGN